MKELKSSELTGSDPENLLSYLFALKGSIIDMYNAQVPGHDEVKDERFRTAAKQAMKRTQVLIDLMIPESYPSYAVEEWGN